MYGVLDLGISAKKRTLAGAFFVGITFVCLIGFIVRHPRVRHILIPESVHVDIPREGLGFSFRRVGVHLIQAEYSRSVKLQDSANWLLLAKNGGNETYVNVYSCHFKGKPFIRLEDATGTYIVDPATNSVYLVVTPGDGNHYFGGFQSENPSTLVCQISDSFNPEPRSEVMIDGEVARSLDLLVGPQPVWRYQGAICGPTNSLKFYGSAEKAERSPCDAG